MQFTDIFMNHVLLCPLAAWTIAQMLKIPVSWYVNRRLDLRRFFGAGGMPSSHTALVCALAIMTGATEGFGSAVFAVSVILAFIVMYDAAGVRRETGNQAQVINAIVRNVLINGEPLWEDDLKELIGHTPFQVLIGALVGIITSTLWIIII